MPKHVLWIGDAQQHDRTLVFTGDEAKHAVRVKRLREGDRVLGLDGAGILVIAEVVSLGRELTIRIIETEEVPTPEPVIQVCAPTPKGTRSGDLVDMLTQVGASRWIPMTTNRSVSSLTEAKRARLDRVAIEACKQSRNPYQLAIDPETTFQNAIERDDAVLVIADQSGEPVTCPDTAIPSSGRIKLLVGPEGGFTDDELQQARDAGAIVRSFGTNIMRIELAATVGSAALSGAHR